MTEPNARHALITVDPGSIGAAFAVAFAFAAAGITILGRPRLTPPALHGPLDMDLDDFPAAQAPVAAARPLDIPVRDAAPVINQPIEAFGIEKREARLRVNAAFAHKGDGARGMKAKCRGRIITLTRLTLNGPWKGFVPHVGSKGALAGLKNGLARDLGPHGIRMHAITPGAVASGAARGVFADRLEECNSFNLERQAIKSRMMPRNVARLARSRALGAAG